MLGALRGLMPSNPTFRPTWVGANWRHCDSRVAAAQAKRERKNRHRLECWTGARA